MQHVTNLLGKTIAPNFCSCCTSEEMEILLSIRFLTHFILFLLRLESKMNESDVFTILTQAQILYKYVKINFHTINFCFKGKKTTTNFPHMYFSQWWEQDHKQLKAKIEMSFARGWNYSSSKYWKKWSRVSFSFLFITR